MLNVLLEERKETPDEVKQVKPRYDWRYENSIIKGKKPIEIDGDYSQWRTNSVLSNHEDMIKIVNYINMYYNVSDQMHYDYLYGATRKYNRWVPPETKQEKKAREDKEALIDSIAEYYKYNTIRAREALTILTPEQLNIIRKGKEKGGVK